MRTVRLVRIAVFSLSSSILVSIGLAPVSQCKSPSYLELEQKSAQLGELVIKIQADGALVVRNKTRGYAIQSKPPRWEIDVFRDSEKSYASMPLEKWCSSTNVLPLLLCPSWDSPVSQSSGKRLKYCNRAAIQYVIEFEKPIKQRRDPILDNVRLSRPGGSPWRKQVRITQFEEHLPKGVERILRKLLGIPAVPGIPARFEVFQSDGTKETLLSTTRIGNVTMALTSMQKLENYRKVNVRELIVSGKERSAFEDLVDDMAVGEAFGTPRTTGKASLNGR